MIIMGHRGAAGLEPENTLLSIERAMEIGVDAVEIDVRLSKDKELVVIHDATVDRTTNGTGPVSSEIFAKPLFTYLHELFDPSTGLLTKS